MPSKKRKTPRKAISTLPSVKRQAVKGKGKLRKPASKPRAVKKGNVKSAGKPAKKNPKESLRKRKGSTLIFIEKTPLKEVERLHKQKIQAVSKLSTSDLEKMQAFGILPFELRRELEKRKRK